MGGLIREQVGRFMSNIRLPFRAVAARNSHGKLIGVDMQGLSGESVSGELFQHYGFSSAPLPGAEYLVIPVGGNSKHAIVAASEDARYRIALQDGEVSIYTDEGDCVHLKRGRVVEIVTETLVVKAGTKVRFETPIVEMTGDQHVDGNVKAEGEVADHSRTMQGDRELYNKHAHPTGNPPLPLQ
ncbi:phage baseplate assembly protein [Pseudomonas sp. NR3]|uniref:phage baseplate assembly protein domain-containing protein n=1 Tax=Pseudomonas sp. NR3 TaxID=3155978 RepID=UPI003B679511